jgi:hypothetical protein
LLTWTVLHQLHQVLLSPLASLLLLFLLLLLLLLLLQLPLLLPLPPLLLPLPLLLLLLLLPQVTPLTKEHTKEVADLFSPAKAAQRTAAEAQPSLSSTSGPAGELRPVHDVYALGDCCANMGGCLRCCCWAASAGLLLDAANTQCMTADNTPDNVPVVVSEQRGPAADATADATAAAVLLLTPHMPFLQIPHSHPWPKLLSSRESTWPTF